MIRVNPLPAVPGLPQPGRTLVIGVVNVTPDSFSDGGEWLEPATAIKHGMDLLDEGADIIDVGGESTRPGAIRPEVSEELRRVLPVIAELAAAGACVSVDTMRECRRCTSCQRRIRRQGRSPDAAACRGIRPPVRLHALAWPR